MENLAYVFGITQRAIQIVDFVGMSFSIGAVPLIAYAYSAKNQECLMEIIRKVPEPLHMSLERVLAERC